MGRIGHPYHVEWYLCEKEAGRYSKKCLDLFYFIPPCSNEQWFKMIRRNVRTCPFEKLARMVDQFNQRLPGHEQHVIPYIKHYEIWANENGIVSTILKAKPHFYFTLEEEKRGQKELAEIIPNNHPFVCFHTRDPAYLNAVFPDRNWNYHNYRDSSIQNYMLAVEKLVQKGYFAVRMGAVVKEKLYTSNPGVINYAESGKRTDFMDVYLGAKCRFFLGTDTGLTMIPEMFRRPVVLANWNILCTISPWVHTGLFIPKKIYSTREQRFLTFSEMLQQRDPGTYMEGFQRQGLELLENTPEEIMAVALEMDDRLKGNWETTDEDEELQKRFWNTFGPNKLMSSSYRIGTDFLRQNQELLK